MIFTGFWQWLAPAPAPSAPSATWTIQAGGVTASSAWNQSVAYGFTSPPTFHAPGRTITGAYLSGSGTNTLVFSLDGPVLAGETVTVSYPSSMVTASSGGLASGAVTNQSVTNSSSLAPLGTVSGRTARIDRGNLDLRVRRI